MDPVPRTVDMRTRDHQCCNAISVSDVNLIGVVKFYDGLRGETRAPRKQFN